MFGGVDDFRYKLNNIDSTKDNDPLTLWGIKNSDEYAVYAKSKNQAIRKFKKDLGIDVKSNSIEIID